MLRRSIEVMSYTTEFPPAAETGQGRARPENDRVKRRKKPDPRKKPGQN